MKIINRSAFLSLPDETLFFKVSKFGYTELSIKGRTVGDDFYVQSLKELNADESIIDTYYTSAETKTSFNLDLDIQSRDGMFDKDQMFAIYEPVDVTQLINRLLRCAKGKQHNG